MDSQTTTHIEVTDEGVSVKHIEYMKLSKDKAARMAVDIERALKPITKKYAKIAQTNKKAREK